MSVVEVNGFKLAYEVHGQGHPVIFIAGLGLDSAPWTETVDSLKEDFRCILIDNRGTGKSETPPGPYTIDDMADDVIAVMDELALESAWAVGWSMGGSILQSLLSRHQNRIDRAVLLSALPRYTPTQDAWLDCLRRLRESDLAPETQAMFSMPWSFSVNSLTDHDKAWELAQLSASNPGVAANDVYEYQSEGLRNYDSRPQLGRITAEVLILVGAEDILTPPEQAIEIAEGIAGSHLVIMPRGGHGMILEFPIDTIGAIRDFLHAGHP